MITPVEPNLKHKTDVLDWEKIPAGTCDLNFRPPSAERPAGAARAINTMMLTALVAVVVSTLFRLLAGQFNSLASPSTAAVVALVVASGIALRLYNPLPVEITGARRWQLSAASLAGVIGLCLLSSWISSVTPLFCLGCLIFVAVPMTLLVADCIATHGVYWMTANPRIDRRTMTGWREDWDGRFSAMADRPARLQPLTGTARRSHAFSMRMRRSYPRGLVWVALGFVCAPVASVLLVRLGLVRNTAGWMLAELMLVLLWLASIRALQAPGSPALFFGALAGWFNYGRDQRAPQWVFRSPLGSQLARQTSAVAATALLSVSLFPIICSAAISNIDSGGLNSAIEAIHPAAEQQNVVRQLVAVGLAAVLLPPAVLLLSAYVVAAPALSSHWLALEAPDAFEQHHDWTAVDGYSERLRSSRNKTEQRHILLGHNPTHEYPVLLDTDLLFEHMHMLGATGVGKTALGLSTLATQLIRRNDGAVIILDCKGDNAYFNTARIEAERAGRKFKWFSNRPYRSTYIFNPWGQKYLHRLTLNEILGIIIQSMNLHHGDDYGRAWFSIAARILLKSALLATMPSQGSRYHRHSAERDRLFPRFGPVESFMDLDEIIRYVAADGKEYQAAKHLGFLVQSLADFEQLNLSPSRQPDESAVRHAIHMPDVIRDKQVIYFSLVGAVDIASVSEIARLALYSTHQAAMAHSDQTGKPPRVYCICDEAQAIVAQNIEQVLSQARAHGLSCVLAHQTMSQLNPPGGVDLRELVMNCTNVKQYFSARDPWLTRYIQEASGQVAYYTTSWDQFKHRVVDQDQVGPRYACSAADGRMRMNVRTMIGNRLEREDIHDISRASNQSVLMIDRAAGYSCFEGAFPLHTDWPIDQREHRRRSHEMPWPAKDEETIELTSDWPAENDETIVTTSHPVLEGPGAKQIATKRLKDLKKKLDLE